MSQRRVPALRPQCQWPGCIRGSRKQGFCAQHAALQHGNLPSETVGHNLDVTSTSGSRLRQHGCAKDPSMQLSEEHITGNQASSSTEPNLASASSSVQRTIHPVKRKSDASCNNPAKHPFRCQWPGCLRVLRGSQEPGLCRQHATLSQAAVQRPISDNGVAPSGEPRDPLPLHPLERSGPRKIGNIPIEEYNDSMVDTLILEGMVLQCPLCGSWNFLAESVQFGRSRRVTLCCKGGKLSHLPPVPDAPEPLRSWLLGTSAVSRTFRQNIRRYNAAMSFVSFGAQLEIKTGAPSGNAPPVCIVHGAVYHHSHPLRPDEPADAQFAQLYLFDTAEAASLRSARDTVLDRDLLFQLASMLDTVQNPYVNAYRRMGELTQELDPSEPRLSNSFSDCISNPITFPHFCQNRFMFTILI